MPRSSRTRNAAIRASHGRAERLQREAGEGRPAKTATRTARSPKTVREPKAERTRKAERASTERDRPAGSDERKTGHKRKPTPLHLAMERNEKSRAASDRQRHQRLKEQTRDAFTRQAERRRDTERRVEQDRKREALQAKVRRVEDNRRRTMQRQAERKREEMRRSFSRAAEDRKAAQLAERQKEMQRRAVLDIDRDQKRRAADQQAAHQRQTAELRKRHNVERNSFRTNENTAMERHHHAIKGIDEREAQRLHDFDGRRNGLAGKIAERIPGRRAENDRQREEIKRGFESERLTKHRDFEALKERQFEREQKNRIDQFKEQKAMMERNEAERSRSAERHAADRTRQIEDRARVLDRVDRQQEHERERERSQPERENVRPTGDSGRAASGQPREPAAGRHEFTRDEGREMERPTRAGRG